MIISKGETMPDEEEKKKEEMIPDKIDGSEIISGKIAPEIIRTILQEGVDFEVTAGRRKRKYIIYPINLGTLFNISKIILTMKEIELTEGDVFAIGMKNIAENKDKIVEIVALAILNCRITFWFRFKKWRLIRYLNQNLTAQELLRLIQLILVQMDVTDFLASFVSIRRLNLVEAKSKENMSTTGKSSVA